MEAFAQGWMCPCEMKLLLRKRDLKRFCRIRLHFQISLLNGIDVKEERLAGFVSDSTLQFPAQAWPRWVPAPCRGRAPTPEGSRHPTPPRAHARAHTHACTHTVGLEAWFAPALNLECLSLWLLLTAWLPTGNQTLKQKNRILFFSTPITWTKKLQLGSANHGAFLRSDCGRRLDKTSARAAPRWFASESTVLGKMRTIRPILHMVL